MNKDKRIKELELEVRRLEDALRTDPLTGALNRRGLEEELEGLFQEVEYSKKHPEARRKIDINDMALVFIDLDDFKKINDSIGHVAGDLALKGTASTLSGNVRGIDSVGRLGGEEFVVILVGAGENEGYKKAEELREKISEIKFSEYSNLSVTASLGVVSAKDSGAESAIALLEYADRAMYEAKKKRGKNTTVKFSELD